LTMGSSKLVLSLILLLGLILIDVHAACNYRVLVGMSSVDYVPLQGGMNHTVGFYLDELATPLRAIVDAGFQVTFANPQGNLPPMDPVSNSSIWFATPNPIKANYLYKQALQLVENMTVNNNFGSPQLYSSITEDQLSQYDGIFIPGGHPPMVDLYKDADLGKILVYFHNNNKPTGMICHGPMATASASLVQTPWIYEGYQMTVYTTAGEKVNELLWGGDLLFYPEDYLGGLNANLSEIEFAAGSIPHVVQDRELTTGMNPFSADMLGTAFVQSLQSYCSQQV